MSIDVSIGGLGVAGSTLLYLLARRGFKVRGSDVARSYHKACGDAVTLKPFTEEVVKSTGSVISYVKRYLIAVNGRVVEEFSLNPPAWAIVDKAGMVSTLRDMAEAEGAEIVWGSWEGRDAQLLVDARGPYSTRSRKGVLLYRVYAPMEWSPDTVLLDFNVRERGVYWVFPADGEGKIVNIGAGFEGLWSAGSIESRINAYYRRLSGGLYLEVLDRRGAPMQLFRGVELYRGGVFRVGEAAGILLRTGGEGNRPAMLSSLYLARAIERAGLADHTRVLALYRLYSAGLLDEIAVSRVLLELVRGSSIKVATSVLESLPRGFWERFVRAEVKSWYVAGLMASRLGLTLGVTRALLSYLVSRTLRRET